MLSPNPAVDLTTTANLTAWLGQAGIPVPSQQTMAYLITALSTQIQSWLNCSLVLTQYTDLYDGNDRSRLFLINTPIIGVSSVTIGAQIVPPAPGLTGAGFTNTQYEVILRGYRFWRGENNVQIVYTAGYQNIPGDVEYCVWEGAAAVLRQAARDPAAKSMRAGDTAIALQQLGTMATKTFGGMVLDPNITGILQPYRRVAGVY